MAVSHLHLVVYWPVCTINISILIPNFAMTGRTIVKILRFNCYQNDDSPPSCISGNSNFNGLEGQDASLCQISCQSVKPLSSYSRFVDF